MPVEPEPLYLSKAHVTDVEVEAVTRAVLGGWVAPLGPEVDAFEAEICDYVGVPYAVALSSGTAALQLGLIGLGVKPGDEVLVPTLTFGATAFAVLHAGARPVFLDVETRSWNLDPHLLADVLKAKAAEGRLPAAVVPVDLLGRTADYDAILPICAEFGVPVLIDAAESLGARHGRRSAGSMGDAAIFSFNGNKIMTTSGGGMLVSTNAALIEKARYRSTQSREPLPWYEHTEVGYNYRLSGVLAALGRAQLQRLPAMIARRTEIHRLYAELLGGLTGVHVQEDPPWGVSNNWLTSVLLDEAVHGRPTHHIQEVLQSQRIEVRQLWKPMHQQPVFADAECFLTGVADKLFMEGLSLPSGVGLTDDDVRRVVEALAKVL